MRGALAKQHGDRAGGGDRSPVCPRTASQTGPGCSGQDGLHFPKVLSVKRPQKCLRTAACHLRGPQRQQGGPGAWGEARAHDAPGPGEPPALPASLSGPKRRRALLRLPACPRAAAHRGLTHVQGAHVHACLGGSRREASPASASLPAATCTYLVPRSRESGRGWGCRSFGGRTLGSGVKSIRKGNPSPVKITWEEHFSITLVCPTGLAVAQHPGAKSGHIPGGGGGQRVLSRPGWEEWLGPV